MKSRHLVTIVRDVELSFDLDECHTHEVEGPAVKLLFEELNFNQLIRRFESLEKEWALNAQPALF